MCGDDDVKEASLRTEELMQRLEHSSGQVPSAEDDIIVDIKKDLPRVAENATKMRCLVQTNVVQFAAGSRILPGRPAR